MEVLGSFFSLSFLRLILMDHSSCDRGCDKSAYRKLVSIQASTSLKWASGHLSIWCWTLQWVTPTLGASRASSHNLLIEHWFESCSPLYEKNRVPEPTCLGSNPSSATLWLFDCMPLGKFNNISRGLSFVSCKLSMRVNVLRDGKLL